jgi:hypothetical protein
VPEIIYIRKSYPHPRPVTLDSIISQTAKHLPRMLLMMIQVPLENDFIVDPIKQRAQCFSLTNIYSISRWKKGGAFLTQSELQPTHVNHPNTKKQSCNSLPRQFEPDGNPFSHQGSWKLLSPKVHQKYLPMSAAGSDCTDYRLMIHTRSFLAPNCHLRPSLVA